MDNQFRPTEYHSIIAKTSENNKHFAAILRKRENFILCISVWTGCGNIGGKVDNLHAREKNGRRGRTKKMPAGNLSTLSSTMWKKLFFFPLVC